MQFQGLTQGAIIPVLFKTVPKVEEARVVSVNTHYPQPNPGNPMAVLNGPVTDITLAIGNDTQTFAGLPASGSVASFPDKGIFISTDRAAVLSEVGAMRAASEQALSQVDAHRKMVADCDALLISLNPEKQKEIAQAKEMSDLKGEIAELKGMLSALLGTAKQKKKEE